MPLLDLHAHFPMHTSFSPSSGRGIVPLGKDLAYWTANMVLNFQGGSPRVSLEAFLEGADGGMASVLYNPYGEFLRDSKPVPETFLDLLSQMDLVEAEIKDKVKLVRNPVDVRKCLLETNEKFLFHAVEGSFALGGDPANLDLLATRGVAYVVVAHLFYRGVVSCVNAIPFVPDGLFNSMLNPEQNEQIGLTDLGRSIVGRLFEKRILVDITHCTDQSRNEIFQMARDYGRLPVISSHNGVRGTSDYPINLGKEDVLQIAELNGVIGIILSSHWLRPPSRHNVEREEIELLFDAIQCVREWTGSFDNIAIGTDLDGFINPINICQTYADTHALVAAIKSKYPKDADRILYGNALRVLEEGWKGSN